MTAPQSTPTPVQLLATPVQFLKGVGPARAELLDRLGLHTVRDVLFFFPRDYQDLSDERERRASWKRASSNRSAAWSKTSTCAAPAKAAASLACRFAASSGHLRALWFNQPFMRERFQFGQRLMLSGKPKLRRADVADAPSAGGSPRPGGRRAGDENAARLSVDRRAATVADSEDRPRRAGSVSARCSTRSFPRST